MQVVSSLSLLTLAAFASAATTFNAITIRSGSKFQFNGIVSNNGQLFVESSGTGVTFTLNDDGTLKDASTGKSIGFDKDKNLIEDVDAAKSFGINDQRLVYNGKEVFVACPADGKYKLSVNTDCTDSLGIALRIQEVASATSSQVSAFTPTTLVTKSSKSTTTATTAKDTAASTDEVQPTQFGVVTIHSGTQFQYNSIKKVDSHPHVFSVGGSEGKDVVFTLKSDTTLADQDNRGVYVDPSTGEVGNVDPWGNEKPSSGFAITGGHLTYKGNDAFNACPSGDKKYSLAINDCVGGTGIALHVINPKKV